MRLLHGHMAVVPLAGLLLVRCECGTVYPIIPPHDPIGDYIGTYIWKTGEGNQVDSLVQAIRWTFTETNYSMDADTADPLYDPEVCFCKGRGTYAMTDRVRLEPANPDNPVPDNCDACDGSKSPQGYYALERPGGGVKLTRIEVVDGIQVTSILQLQRPVQE